MKPSSYATLLLFIAVLTASCKKIPVIENSNSQLSFKIDGVQKEIKGNKDVIAIHLTKINLLQIVGNFDPSNENGISLTISDFKGVGEYTVGNNFLGMYTAADLPQSALSVEGKVKITEYIEGKSIKGEFQFKGELLVVSTDPNTEPVFKNITDGKFASKLTISNEIIDFPED